MAWHILHGLLEQVRTQSTFPGKLWIVIMFVFRIVVVARIGDNVYHDEQSSFICNTLTPGCTNVCFNRFSPISQLRFWSLMVLVVTAPSIFYFMYAMHEIYNAGIKYPFKGRKGAESPKLASQKTVSKSNLNKLYTSKNKQRREYCQKEFQGIAAPLYVVTKIPKKRENLRWGRFLRKRRNDSRDNEETMELKKSGSNDQFLDVRDRSGVPIYTNATYRHVEFVKDNSREERDPVLERKFRTKMLQHPELARAYWWHVVLRTCSEAAFLVGQYYLYGLSVPELYECHYYPCPKPVDCFVSRPQEKTCLLWLMYGLGVIACVLSIAEFCCLGFSGISNAFLCCGGEETYEERKKRLAMLEPPKPAKNPRGGAHSEGLTRVLSLDSISSDTTVESV